MIQWSYDDVRFKPGTVADFKHIRLILRQATSNGVETTTWRLGVSIRTYAADGVRNELKQAVKVAEFKKCADLSEAQNRAEAWFESFKLSLIF